MQIQIGTTPFGRRPIPLDQFAARMLASEAPPRATSSDKALTGRQCRTPVDKWALYDDLREAATRHGIGDRSLAVLHALLSFHPGKELAEGSELTVFPSNKQLAARAHGMADATLRRHLNALIEAGLLLRHDSANGKRFARRDRQGRITQAFGFSLRPLLERADAIRKDAEDLRHQKVRLRLCRERITLMRRDIGRITETVFAANSAEDAEHAGARIDIAVWQRIHADLRDIVDRIPRRASLEMLQPIEAALETLHQDTIKQLKRLQSAKEMSGSAAENERHHGESDTDSISESEARQRSRSNDESLDRDEPTDLNKPSAAKAGPCKPTVTPSARFRVVTPQPTHGSSRPACEIDLATILRICPDICDYALHGITRWADLIETAGRVSVFLGIDPRAHQEAIGSMGPHRTAIIVAYILQRHDEIENPGGYLRSLIARVRREPFALQPLIDSLQRRRMPSVDRSGAAMHQTCRGPAAAG